MYAKSTASLLQVVCSARFRIRKIVSVAVLSTLLVLLAGVLGERTSEHRLTWQPSHRTADAIMAEANGPESHAAPEVVLPSPEDRRYRALAQFLSSKYKVSQDVTLDLVSIAHAAGHQIGLDPLLIIAVIAVESRFNPIAESVAGAKGLMQVIPQYHTEKLRKYGPGKSVFDPETNILVGARILKDYLRRTGNLSMALQMYGGALKDREDVYTTKVMTEKQRLQQVIGGAGSGPTPAKAAGSQRTADKVPL